MTASRATVRAKNEGTACSDQEVESGEDKGKYYSVRLFVCVICLIQLYNVLNNTFLGSIFTISHKYSIVLSEFTSNSAPCYEFQMVFCYLKPRSSPTRLL